MSKFSKAFAEERKDSEITLVTEAIIADIKEGKSLKYDSLSLRDIAESTLGYKGCAILRDANMRKVSEAVAPVRLSAFSRITNEIVSQAGIEGFQSPDFIGDQLTTAENSNDDNGRLIGIEPMDDEAMEVREGHEYPSAQLSEDFLTVPTSKKVGLRIGLTKEAVFFDKTGQLIQRAKEIAGRVGLAKEKRTLRIVLGIDNSYNRKDVSRNTYVASADPRINSFTGRTLDDWTAIEDAEQSFADYVDDRTTGEPVDIGATMLIVPQDLKTSGSRIMNTLEVRTINGAQEMITKNPISVGGMISSAWIRWMLVNEGGIAIADARKYWYYGNPKKAFTYRTIFPFSMIEAGQSHDAYFDSDIVNQWRAMERGVAYVAAPWYMQKNIGA